MTKVPSHLTTKSSWLWEGTNNTNLRLFLQAYDVDINDVYEIQFAKRSMKVFRYGNDESGRKFLIGDDAATRKPLTVRYRGGLTHNALS